MLSVTLALFAPAIGFGPAYEDARDPRVTLDPGAVWHQIESQPFRTMTHLTRALEFVAFGGQWWGFHLGSILIHLVNVALVLAIGWLLLPPWGAVLAAGVFAWHPIQVEAVVYVSARPDLVCTVGILLAVLSTSLGSLAGVVVGVLFACLSKEAAVVAWALVPLWAAWTRAPFAWLTWAAISGAGFLAGGVFLVLWIRDWHMTLDSVLIGQQLAAIWRLVALVLVPWGFSVDHDWASIAWLGPGALLASIAVTLWALLEGWKRQSWFAFAWLWTLIALSPRLVVPLYEGLHEHHFYVVLVGWCLCAGHWLTKGRAGRGSTWPAVSQT